jgi:GDP-L-fucose synthase
MKNKMYKMNFWGNKKVIVICGAGFLGSYVVEKLKELRM